MFGKKPFVKDFEYSGDVNPSDVKRFGNYELIVFILKFLFVIALSATGCYLIYLGISSDATIEFSFGKATLKLNNAAPGLVLIIIGAFILVYSQIKIKARK